MPDLKKMLTLEALSEALPSWLKRSTKPEYNADEIDSTLTTNQFVTASDKDNWNAKGTYSKPSGGIPKSDLSSIVQTSLEKADSALQSETDPTVPSWAKQLNKPSYNSDEISDTNRTHKFATAAQLTQISTNQTNILYALNTGVKNLIVCNEKKAVANGLTITRTQDGIQISGTATASFSLAITGNALAEETQDPYDYSVFSKLPSSVILTGAPDSVEQNRIIVALYNDQTWVYSFSSLYDMTQDLSNYNYNRWYAYIPIVQNKTYSGIWKPMLRDASISDDTFVPGALPNSDLTQGLAELNAHPFLTVPINHNMIYRGKNLGDTLTDAQHTALSGGNFTDLYLGDYWTKKVTITAGTYTGGDGKEVTVPAQTNITLKAVIADFDTFYAGYASSYAGINTHHAAVIVTGFSNVVWNGTNSTAGGYVNSLIHKWLVGSVLPQIETWFGSAKVLSHQKLLTNAITGDAASGWNWSSQKISLLSENQMYGSKVWGNSKASNGGYEPGEAFKHLNVFNHIDANLLFGNKNIWLRDIASAVGVAGLDNYGRAGHNDASATWIAPAALILLS